MSVLSETYEPTVYVNPRIWVRSHPASAETIMAYEHYMIELLKTCKISDYCTSMIIRAHQMVCEHLHGRRYKVVSIYDDIVLHGIRTEITRERGSNNCLFRCDIHHMGSVSFSIYPFPPIDQKFRENPFNSYTEENVITKLRSRDYISDPDSWF